MKHIASAAAALLLSTTLVSAAGIERSAVPTSVLFEDGRYLQLSFSSSRPSVDGDYPDGAPFGGGSTDNMAKSFRNFGAAYKADLNENLSFGIFLNQPYGANAQYTNGLYEGLQADWYSNQVAVLLKYTTDTNLSFYGGFRYVESRAEIIIPDALVRGRAAAEAQALQAAAQDIVNNQIPAAAVANPALIPGLVAQATQLGAQATAIAAQNDLVNQPFGSLDYEATGDRDGQFGAILGVAYERPDIALRVGLTWEQGVTHEFETSESFGDFFDTDDGKTEVDMPQSVTLDFQTGVAPGTLLFGSVKWTEWSVWEVRTPEYEELTGTAVTGIDDDAFTYKLGLGRAITDDFSVFGQLTYEPSNGSELSRLSPTDGRRAIALGGSYTYDNVTFRGGVEYSRLGGGEDGSGVQFDDNDNVSVGLTIGYSF